MVWCTFNSLCIRNTELTMIYRAFQDHEARENPAGKTRQRLKKTHRQYAQRGKHQSGQMVTHLVNEYDRDARKAIVAESAYVYSQRATGNDVRISDLTRRRGPQLTSAIPCRFGDRCLFGDVCRYAHVQPTLTASPTLTAPPAAPTPTTDDNKDMDQLRAQMAEQLRTTADLQRTTADLQKQLVAMMALMRQSISSTNSEASLPSDDSEANRPSDD